MTIRPHSHGTDRNCRRVLELARQAGFVIHESDDPNSPPSWHGQAHNDTFEKFAELLSPRSEKLPTGLRATQKALQRRYEDGLNAVQRELDLVVVEYENEESLIQHLTDRISALKKADPQPQVDATVESDAPQGGQGGYKAVGSAPCVERPSEESVKLAKSVMRHVGDISHLTSGMAAECLAREILRLDDKHGELVTLLRHEAEHGLYVTKVAAGLMRRAADALSAPSATAPTSPYDLGALDAASVEVHKMLLREGSDWGTKACEEMGRVFMTAYLKALPTERGPT